MIEESLLTDDVRALVGKVTSRSVARITPQALFRASDTFYGHGWEPVPAPGEPVPGITLGALEIESGGLHLPEILPSTIIISNEWQFERQLKMGEEVEVVSRIADISERVGGRFGYSLHFRTEVAFQEPGDGPVIARTVQTMMQYDPANASDDGGAE